MAKIKEAIEDFRPDPRLVDERGPTNARMRKADGDFVRGGATRTVQVRDAPLERMWTRKVLTEKQYNGLNKYRIHWYHAGMAGKMGALDPEHIFASDISNFSGLAKTERQVFHQQQYRKGVQKLGLRKSTIVEMVVCQEQLLEDAGRRLSWGNKSQAIAAATEVLRGAAEELCEMWGL